MVGSHVLGNTPGSLKSFEVTLRSWGPPEVVQPADDLQHGGKAEFAHSKAQALMRPKAEMRVQAHVPVQFYLVGLGECHGVMGCRNLYSPVSTCGQSTVDLSKDGGVAYQIAKNFLACLQVDLLAVILDN